MSEKLQQIENLPTSDPVPESLTAKKFLQISYPLSEEGLKLRKAVEEGTANDKDLPTVENPRPELFAELEGSEEMKSEIFGENLSTIQVTKGCRHKCTFCAAGAAETVDTMPFPAVVKAAEQKRKGDQVLVSQALDYFNVIERETGYDIEAIRRIKTHHDDLPQTDPPREEMTREEKSRVGKKVAEIFFRHPLFEMYRRSHPKIVSKFEESWSRYSGSSFMTFDMYTPVDFDDNFLGEMFDSVTNYYDSDPLDYRDRNFLHTDGSPADFGDVAKLLASPIRPLHITTAGWSKTDKVAESAVGKLVEMGKENFRGIRLSINKYEVRARKNTQAYLEDTKHSIDTLAPLGLKVLLFDDKQDEGWTKVVDEIHAYCEGVDGASAVRPIISLYSGPMKSSEHEDDHHDVMSCMPGYHILPDGSVAKQQRDENSRFGAPKGSRPTPTGMRLWKK